MADPRLIGEAADYDAFIQLYRARINELGLTFETVDYLSGLQTGYTAKLLGPMQTKTVGPVSMPLLNKTLAIKILVVEDVDAAREMEPRWERRERPANVGAVRTARIGKTTMARVLPDVAREMQKRSRETYRDVTKASTRRRIARLAARARWRGKRKGQKRASKRPTSQCASAQPAPVKKPTQNQTPSK